MSQVLHLNLILFFSCKLLNLCANVSIVFHKLEISFFFFQAGNFLTPNSTTRRIISCKSHHPFVSKAKI